MSPRFGQVSFPDVALRFPNTFHLFEGYLFNALSGRSYVVTLAFTDILTVRVLCGVPHFEPKLDEDSVTIERIGLGLLPANGCGETEGGCECSYTSGFCWI